LQGPVTEEAYRIQPGDELEVRFFHTPEQNVILPVRPDGLISLPLAYEVRAAGRTPEELRQDLVQRYTQELMKPEIAVIVRTITGYQVHVGGEVGRAGVLELTGPATVLQAVFQAGGFLTSASPEHTIVVRRHDDGGYEIHELDLAAVLEGEDARGNMLLQPFDVVFIPRSRVAEVNKWVDLYIRRNIPITFSYRFESL
jgi:protein involved in polysaccharide export with SLBB domain